MSCSTYTIRPFSGPRFRENSERGGDTPCCICGKAIKDPQQKRMAVVIDGGAAWGDENSDPNDGGYMGYFPVGRDCHRRYAMKRPKPNYAGLRRWIRAKATGTYVGVYDGIAAGMDTDAGRWQTVCDEHGWIISHRTLALAMQHAPHPEEWCDVCSGEAPES